MESAPQNLRLEMASIVLVGLLLNLSGAVVGKVLAMHLGRTWVVLMLSTLLGITFICRMGFWLRVGKRWQLSYVYPFLSINYVMAMVVGVVLFHEKWHMFRLVGSFVVMSGVWILSRSSFRQELAQ